MTESKQPIAVVGMSGLFPGALDLDTFWQNIINKVDATSAVPPERWIVEPDAIIAPDPRPDKAYSQRACLIQGFQFDPQGIDIDEDLFKALDPLYHIVLHAGRQALSDCSISTVNKNRIGTILAAIALPTDASSSITREILGASFEEKLLGKRFAPRNRSLKLNNCLAGKVTSLPAAILAQGLGLGGGSFTLDAACASSLYAVKLACDELRHFRADAMLAGGVSRPECLYTQIGFSQLRALSPTGRCAPFDQSANGLVVGEGAGIMVLKRLADALQAGDTIYGVIRGIGLANDIGGNLLSPHSEGQVRAMRKAYEAAAWQPPEVDLIECHGAGTPVGDLTELNSLNTLWGASGWSRRQCAIGSVKSMIGHLLTAAGAAGLIKTLLAIKYRTLPPSLKFTRPPEKSSLDNGPFRVQTEPEMWTRRGQQTPLRAAVSAFGFGGINAHVLLEEWFPDKPAGRHPDNPDSQNLSVAPAPATARISAKIETRDPRPGKPVAIIGMEAAAGPISSLRLFQEAVFNGKAFFSEQTENRWKGAQSTASRFLGSRAAWGGFMNELTIEMGQFHIPPNEIPDIIPQHLLMLKVATAALKDAGLPLRADRPDMSVFIGMDFDFEATNFHLRWNLLNEFPKWTETLGADLDRGEIFAWLEQLRQACGPPLTPTRTLGALGGIIASRIARELRLGGASFVVSGEEASGLRALEIGIRALQEKEADTVLVGAVDLAGDIRSVITADRIRPYSQRSIVSPFDRSADGTLPGDGAAALVLKRLDRALKDGDRIYAVIRGIGGANEGAGDRSPSVDAYTRSLENAFEDSGVPPDSITFFETHGSGHPLEDNLEAQALHAFFPARDPSGSEACAIGSVKSIIGHIGAAAGLLSVVKTAVCLYQEIIPPLKNFREPIDNTWQCDRFHIPIQPQFWLRDRQKGPRRACTGALTADGNCMHVILEGFDTPAAAAQPEKISARLKSEKNRPLGPNPWGLFTVTADTQNALIENLDILETHVRHAAGKKQPVERTAQSWFAKQPSHSAEKYGVALVAADSTRLGELIKEAKQAISANVPVQMGASGGICYFPKPLGHSSPIAFVFPGSGNHYLGMAGDMGVRRPEILRQMDAEARQLKRQMLPHLYMPWRTSWRPGWETEASKAIAADPLNTIFGQVVFGSVAANVIAEFNILPSAVIGYSLGESAGLFAMKTWPDREEMLKRMLKTDLFTLQLAGPCEAARKAWKIPPDEPFTWSVAAVNRPAETISALVSQHPQVKLLIVNTPTECVIGGRREQVEAAIKALGCEAFFLEGVVTVHCDAALPVAEAYRQLHIFPVNNPNNIRFYSCALGKSYELTSENAADSILKQAVAGFDFTATINQAYADGIRVFIEIGPHSSCTRMIHNILDNRPHRAVSASTRSEAEHLTLLKLLGTLIAERVPVNLEELYGGILSPIFSESSDQKESDSSITIMVGGRPARPEPPRKIRAIEERESDIPFADLIEPMRKNMEATSAAHQKFLDFSDELQDAIADTFKLQTRLLGKMLPTKQPAELQSLLDADATTTPPDIQLGREFYPTPAKQVSDRIPAYNREMCMEFAVGSVAKVLGPDFTVVDTYQTRVRLPDEPLMLVDRILSLEGEKGSLGSGRIVTEHDVLPHAWYLDGGRAPTCISVEAGQADLFLCAYLGIDLAVKGERTYRLLDATVKFHRGLPRPGDIIRYEITIERFARQGDTYLFFFHFEGFIGDTHLISMTNGCAGFFTPEEVKKSGGIILTEEEKQPLQKKTVPLPESLKPLVPAETESYDESALQALREGNLSGCFGSLFTGVQISDSLKLPGGRMKLIDRVLSLDPAGGRYGRGRIRAEADIHPDDWFLTCHFRDDMVMPGTLMYECCAHTLRVFLQRLGWVSDKPDSCYEPVAGIASVLKCRGPVTPDTRRVVYEVEIKTISYDPEPYVIADAHMYADDHYIVWFKDMSIKLTGVSCETLEAFWNDSLGRAAPERKTATPAPATPRPPIYDREHILAFAIGKPSKAFGEPYQPFDDKRVIARLPAPPYSFLDRIAAVEPQPWVLKPDGWIQAETDISADAWYFSADRNRIMPYCILLEVALQPCGWLAAYMGSALKSNHDLKFRNLGGKGVIHANISSDPKILIVRSRLTKVSEAADMIIEHFDFQVLLNRQMIYEGDTYFGFFTQATLDRQIGIRDADQNRYFPTPEEVKKGRSFTFSDDDPLTPDDPGHTAALRLAMPAKALRMIDTIETYVPNGGPNGLGFIRGIKSVDPGEWFFKAHFYQDPVCPGSLGIESFLQLLKFVALDRWQHLADSHCFSLLLGQSHQWLYRGQIVPRNQKIEVEAVITRVEETPQPTIMANGFLKVDGVYIYQMEDFGISLIPINKK